MKALNPNRPPDHRGFTRRSAGLTALAAAKPLAGLTPAEAAEPLPDHKSIGLQVGAISFVAEGTEKVLDRLQERGAIDTIYLTTFTWSQGLAGRQIPGHAVPDRNRQESDES